MQLRVTRLCLDCEELYVGSSCPICASERFAFLSSWLPSEERRRWRRPAPKVAPAAKRHLQTLKRFLAGWFGDAAPEQTPGGPRTRASDFVPALDFEKRGKEPQKQPAHVTQPLKNDR